MKNFFVVYEGPAEKGRPGQLPVSYMAYGKEQHELARLLDFRQSSSNHFLAVNQLNVAGRRGRRIPDVLLSINGLPLVIFELKNPLDVNAGLHRVFNQLQTYQEDIADLFVFNQIQVINAVAAKVNICRYARKKSRCGGIFRRRNGQQAATCFDSCEIRRLGRYRS